MVAKELLGVHNYVALWRMWRLYPNLRENLARYFLGRGEYPYACRVRTPVGSVAPTLFSRHDMLTFNEVFCRQDYGVGSDARAVVDIGSNIGISALYFLTRNRFCQCWLYEPVPRNVERLRRNLAGHEERHSLHETAVATVDGRAAFGVEESGRYGGIGVATGETIEVECVGINELLEEVLGSVPAVDVLKIDTEGTELMLFQAIRPELLESVRAVYLEVERRPADDPPGFDSAFRNQTLFLRNRRL